MSEKDRLSPEALQNKIQYNIQYGKENYKIFKTPLKIEEYEEIDKYIKNKKISKADFIRLAYDKLKNTK